MSSQLLDIQSSPFVISNDNTEQQIYGYTVYNGTVNAAKVLRVIFIGKLSTKTLAPGTITLKFKFGAIEVTVISETPLLGLTDKNFMIVLDCWLIPGTTDFVLIDGSFTQDGSSIFSPAGQRFNVNSGNVNFGINNTIGISVQFSVANAQNIFERTMLSLWEV